MNNLYRAAARLPFWNYTPAVFRSLALAATNPPTGASHLQVEPTRKCNLKCVMCARTHVGSEPRADLSLAAFKRAIDQIPTLDRVSLNGLGEPFLNKHLLDMVEYARGKGLYTRFNTNFSCVTDAMIERIVTSGHSEITISMETCDPDVFADIRRGTSLDVVMGNLVKLIEARRRHNSNTPKILVYSILMKCVLPHMTDFVKTIKELGVDHLTITDLNTNGVDLKAPMRDGSSMSDQVLLNSLSEAEIWDIIREIKSFEDESFEVVVPGDYGGLKRDKAPKAGVLTCEELWEMPYMTCDGVVTPCCWAPHPGIFNMGNLQDHSFEDIWFGAPYRRLRAQHVLNRHPRYCGNCQQLVHTLAAPSRLLDSSPSAHPIDSCFIHLRARMRLPEPHPSPLRKNLQRLTSAARLALRLVERARAAGIRSACALGKASLVNAYIRMRERFGAALRVECPCCGWRGYDFRTIDCGSFTVPSVECPQCRSQERQRMLHLYFHRQAPEFFEQEGRVLHFAPEPHVRALIDRNPRLKTLSCDYALSAIDRVAGDRFQTDMQHLALADDSVDAIFCLHVLEHVPDDGKGLQEMHRALKPGACAYIMVPFMMGWPATREFGKPDPLIFDHVRGYSLHDFAARLSAFDYDAIRPGDFLTQEEMKRFRIPEDSQIIYRCFKERPPSAS